jgi:hypothetical protein
MAEDHSSLASPADPHAASAVGFTPGPWRVELAHKGFRRPNDDEAVDLMIVSPDLTCPGIVWEHGKVGEANARLIAAAPDLLDVAEWAERLGAGVAECITDTGGADRLRLSDGTVLTGQAATAMLELCRAVISTGALARAAISKATQP